MTVTSAGTSPRAEILDLLAVSFGRVLRLVGVAASPAEVIEIRRTLSIVGAGELSVLRAALRSVCVKYCYETAGFEQAFDLFFLGADRGRHAEELPVPRGVAADLPQDVEWDEEFEGAARRIGADEHTDEIGHLMAPDPEAADPDAEPRAESAHREENDFSVSAGAEHLGVDPDSGSAGGGVTYTVEVDAADSSTVGELTGAAARVAGRPLGLAGAASILAALDAYDPRKAYGSDGLADLDDTRRGELERALAAFVDALANRLEAASVVADPSATAPTHPASAHPDQPEIDRACHRLIQRIRGAPRRVVRPVDRGTLDIRATMRAAVATDGVPAELWRRRHRPGPVRMLVLIDVSLSVRPVAGFILRLAQTLHRFGNRCEVIAFVDRPVRVTPALRAGSPDAALTSVLAADGLDLAGTSDYGRMLAELLGEFGDLITSRTSVLVVGDARSNGFDPRVDLFAEVARRAHRVAWVTPEPARYWPQSGCAMADYAEHCAGVVSVRDGDELVARCDELGAALR
ncbi:VWA domain-containing protein [Gordonia jinghuaiqii]|uniref:VWA domain-containing protein n=1 Tax=Gordonia jinghuaiqii TaxID=2758710 RepID=A0A7D7LWE2_9ACTN|nr:VWA domain-containing protein [Gordonia jinghuaiqii]MCR5980097.1 VWA domain-containing protein [Gordonia jinghuaiqii]QMT03281.1 VWA domain-containing protein [Gordonia jinghuaiqii]